MNLIVTSAARLRESYGQAAARRVLAAVDRLIAARAARGVVSRLILIEEGIAELGVSGAAVAAAGIAAQIAQAAQALERAGDLLESLLIVGGPEIVPFHLAANPTAYDGDDVVPSDCIYGACNPFAQLSDWPVGRLPGAAGDDPDLLLRLLEVAATAHPADRLRKTFGYCTAAWRRSAAQVYATVDAPERLLVSPPIEAATLDRARLDGARLIYCNLHGVMDGPPWYGQLEEQSAWLVALRPSDIAGLDLRGAVVITEACYGAALHGRNEDTSLALAMLARGAIGFVGPTAISYGPPTPPLGEADLIALHFLRALRRPGVTLGAAFVAARMGMLRDTLAQQSTLDEDDQKTLLEFVLYGDPTLVLG
ncbi:MAG TPA: C25 family cysteine peptidase [Roseiflexaceae bacterium]|nr:C25 family cysteine peptidase [Roseiflexaceae bacterium]